MSPRGSLILLFAFTPLFRCAGSPPPHADALTPPPSVASVAPASPTHPPPPPPQVPTIPGSIDGAALLANGHILVVSASNIFDWDPTRPASLPRVDIPLEKSEETSIRASSGSSRFVVVRKSKSDELTFDLWDAAALAKVATLGGTWSHSEPSAPSWSEDDHRLLVFACRMHPKDNERSDCEAAVYSLPDGALVHRTSIPDLPIGPYLIDARISPAGTTFSLSHLSLPIHTFESDTGKTVFRSPPPGREDYLRSSGAKFIYLDDHRLLTSTQHGGRLLVIDLPSGRTLATADHRLKQGESAVDHSLSPDKTRIASLLKHGITVRVAIWSLDASEPTTHPIPETICKDFECELQWSGPRDLIVQSIAASPANDLHIDLESGADRVEPHRPLPRIVMGGFALSGDFTISGNERTAWVGTIQQNGVPTPTLVTPNGAKVEIPSIKPNGARVDAYGDRFMAVTRDRLTVVTKDGAVSVLDSSGRR